MKFLISASPPKILSSLSPVMLSSKRDSAEASEKQMISDELLGTGGPRIKHVCRRAAMVIRKPLATFTAVEGSTPTPTLSALPSPEKEKLLRTQAANKDKINGQFISLPICHLISVYF